MTTIKLGELVLWAVFTASVLVAVYGLFLYLRHKVHTSSEDRIEAGQVWTNIFGEVWRVESVSVLKSGGYEGEKVAHWTHEFDGKLNGHELDRADANNGKWGRAKRHKTAKVGVLMNHLSEAGAWIAKTGKTDKTDKTGRAKK